MKMQTEINNAWKMWDKTRDIKYKNLWYKLIKEWAHGFNNTTGRSIPSSADNSRTSNR